MFFWVFILAFSVVNCDFPSEDFIIDMPDIELRNASTTPFQVYWNVPTKQCRSKNIPFDDLLHKFKISYNKNDRFEGETITIIYNVGIIPAILKRDGGKFSIRNGGLPQEGNLELHLTAFRETVIRLIPDPDFNGVGVLDMEDWRPIFRQHWSKLAPIIDLSLSIEKRQYWWWPASWQKMEAKKRFEDAARMFMEKTLSTAKQMRPKAVWGYYGFPYCFNMDDKNKVEHCSKDIKGENDRTYWLWAESTALYPSIYSRSYLSTYEREKLVRGRLTEANRVKKARDLVLPYFSILYRDGGFFDEKNAIAVFETLQKKNASGVIIWVGSSDVNSVDKCKQLYNYVDSIFGPIAKKYIQRINKLRENKIQEVSKHIDDSNDSLNNSSSVIATTHSTTFYSIEDNTIPNLIPTTKKPKNISHNNELEHQQNKYFYETDDNKTYSQSSQEIVILSINMMNPVNILDINVTKMTEEQEQQLNKYYYENNDSRVELENSSEKKLWSIIKYNTSFENENVTEIISEQFIRSPEVLSQEHTGPYLNLSTTTYTISNNKTKDCKDKSENFLITIENSTYSSNKTKNNTETYILNDLIKSSLKTNPINTSVVNNNMETNPEFVQTIEQEEQLNNYYYKTDDNKEELKRSNVSDIWSIIKYETTSENENITESIKSKQYTESPEGFIPKHTEFTWLTIKNDTGDIHKFDKERHLINNTYHNIEDYVDSENNNIADDSGTLVFNSTRSFTIFVNTRNMDIVNQTKASNENNMSDNLITITQDFNNSRNTSMNGNNTENTTYPNIEKTNNEVKNVSDYSVILAEDFTSLMNMSMSGNDTEITKKNSKDISQNVTQEVQLEKNTSYLNIEAKARGKNDMSDYLITLADDFTNSGNTSMNGNDTETKLENEEQFTENTTYRNIETTNNEVKNVSDYSMILAEDFTSLMNTSMSGNDTEITNNFSKDISQNVKQEEQFEKNTSYLNIEPKASGKNDMSDYLITLAKDFTNSGNTSMKCNDTEINLTKFSRKNNVSDYLITLTEDFTYTVNTSMSGDDTETKLENEEQFTENTTYRNIETTNNEVKNVSDYSMILAEDFTSLMNTSMSGNDTEITNNFSKDISQNVKQEEQFEKNTSYLNIGPKASGKNDMSDYLITLAKDFTNSGNTSMKFNDTEINLTKFSRKNNVSDYLITLTEDFTYTVNTSMSGDDTETKLENEEQFTKNTTYPNIETTNNEVKNVSDSAMILVENFTIKSGNDTEVTNKKNNS